jgi:hypothetical protein
MLFDIHAEPWQHQTVFPGFILDVTLRLDDFGSGVINPEGLFTIVIEINSKFSFTSKELHD